MTDQFTRPLTAHFTWAEVTRSTTASKRGIDNTLPAELTANVEQTAQYMEAVRLELGGWPLKINSWYRCPALNAAVGGSLTSVHPKGLATDFEPTRMPLAAAFEHLARSGIPYDQLIREGTRDGADWIHIGFAEANRPHRRQVLRGAGAKLGGRMTFTRVAAG